MYLAAMCLPLYSLYIYHQYVLSISRYKMTLDEFELRRRDHSTPRVALGRYNASPFEYFYYSFNDQVLLNATGCNHREFTILLGKFKPYYHYYTFHPDTGIIFRKICYQNGNPKGRKRYMSAV